jgi:hypothetical protein
MTLPRVCIRSTDKTPQIQFEGIHMKKERSTIVRPNKNLANADLCFPLNAAKGVLAEFAHQLANGTEVPEEFYFVAALAMFGAACSPDLTMDIGMEIDTRFYTVLLGDSYSVKKSTAMRNTIDFFSKLAIRPLKVTHGVGSAEGLARELVTNPCLVLAHDELRSFLDKTKVQSSVLLPMATSLFESHDWDNLTKEKDKCVSVRNAHLSLIGCCTTATYENMWSQEAIAIGFPNRLLLVNADAKPKVAWPKAATDVALRDIKARIQELLARLPLKYEISPDAKRQWEVWYEGLPSTEHVKRLDTIGLRLLPVLALTNDKPIIDKETVEAVCAILDYELRLRILTDPIDADDRIAKLEERVRRTLKSRGALSNRELRRSVHAEREGVWAYERAMKNLLRAGDISESEGRFFLVPEAELASPEVSPAFNLSEA